MKPSVSVIIPTYNRLELLEVILPSYLKSEFVDELILVDDCSNPSTQEGLQALACSDSRIKILINEMNSGAPASRNRGIASASGNLLLLSEDDLELGEGYMETLIRHMQESNADIISGRRLWMRAGESKEGIIARSSDVKLPVVNLRWMEFYSNAITNDDVEAPLLDGTMLMRKEVAQVVRYHEPFGGPSTWREESDFQLSALGKGFRLVFCPHAVCFHLPRLSASFGPNRMRGDLRYLARIFHNNCLFLARHQSLLEKYYPSAILLHSSKITSIFYTLRQAVWLLRTETQRWLNSRLHPVFSWK
jgi:GT2 family glycosyltransferase